MIKKHIPNAITCANLFSGCVGVVFAFKGEPETAAYFVLLSGIFDFFDGMAARLLRVKSAIGKELDSLADMVSFGFLPGIILYHLLQKTNDYTYLPYLGFVITIFSALRLAKFNTDDRQTEDFIGLNTPMNTLFIVSLPFIGRDYPWIIYNPYVLCGIIAVNSYLLISEIRIFSMKLNDTSWAANQMKYLFLICSLILGMALKFIAIPFILVLYIVFSIIHFNKMDKKKKYN